MTRSILACVAAVATTLAAVPTAAAEPVTTGLFSSYQQVRVVGDRAYVASFAGLVIYDVTDHANPHELSHLVLDRSGAFKVEVSGNYAYVLSGLFVLEQAILRVVDVSDPTAPHVVAEVTDLADSRAQGILVVGDALAVANGGAVDLFDISDPTSPTRAGSVQVTPDPGQVVGLAANGTMIFAAWQGIDDGGNPFNGVTAVDAADPSAPAARGTLDLGADTVPYTIAAVGDTVYVGQVPSATAVVDASDPDALETVARLEYAMRPRANVFAKGNRLFASTDPQDGSGNEVRVYDVADPKAPALLATTSHACSVVGMDYDPETADAFMPCTDAAGSGLAIFAVPASGELAPVWSDSTPETVDVEVAGDVTYLVGSTSLTTVRPADGGGVDVLGRLDLGQRAFRLQVDGARVYVLTADTSVGANAHVQIVDATDPTALTFVGSLDATGSGILVTAKRFFVSGDRLYLAVPGALEVYDVADAMQPAKLGSVALPGVAENVVVDGTTAYVNVLRIVDGIQQTDLFTVNVKKPAKPKVRKKLVNVDRITYGNDLLLHGDRLYMSVAGGGGPNPVAGDGRLVVVDVSKAKPKLVTKLPTSPTLNGYAVGLDAHGDELFVADGLDGVSIFSIAGSDDPTYTQAIDTGGFATGVSVADDGGVSIADGSSFLRYAPEAPVGGK
jgi:hypothetical protein